MGGLEEDGGAAMVVHTPLAPASASASASASTPSRWLVVFASWLQHFTILGTLYSSGLYILPMARSFDTGRGAVSWVGSLWYGQTILWSLPASILPDKIGLKWLSFTCAVLLGCGLAGSAEARQLWGLYVLSILVGLGLSCISNASVMVQPWFPKNRGRATGVAMTGSGAGNFVYALALQAVINSYDDGHCSDEASVQGDDGVKCEGWRWALRYEAALSFGLCAIASLMVARPVNAAPTVHAMRRLTMSTTAAKLLDTGPVGGPVRVSTMALVGTPCSRAMAIYWFFAGFGYLNVFAHFAAHAEDSGLSKWDAALLLSFMGLASVCGRVLLGLAADRFNRIHVLAFTCFMLALTAAVWPAATSFDGLVVIALLYGFFAGGIPSLPPTIMADYYSDQFGTRIFVLYSCTFVCQLPGTMVGPPICGWIYDSDNEYYGAGAFSAVALIISGLAVLTIPPIEQHHKLVDNLVNTARGATPEAPQTGASNTAANAVASSLESESRRRISII